MNLKKKDKIKNNNNNNIMHIMKISPYLDRQKRQDQLYFDRNAEALSFIPLIDELAL